jgi:sensor c-di-GMP phosphodiesterase-like protein
MSASAYQQSRAGLRHATLSAAEPGGDAAEEQKLSRHGAPGWPWWRPIRTWMHLAGRRRMGRRNLSVSHAKLTRVVIAGAVIGSPLMLGLGVVVVLKAEQQWVRREAQDLIAPVRLREAEVTGVLAALDRMQDAPCSPADLARLRAIVLGSTIILDIVRRDHGRLACSAVYGVADIKIPAVARPGVVLTPDQTIWHNADLPGVAGRKVTIVGHNNSFVVVRPGITPPDFAPGGLSLSRFFINKSRQEISWFAGKPIHVRPGLLEEGSSFWLQGSYVAVACATDRMMCIVLKAPWSAMLRKNQSPFEIFALAGGVAGSAANLILLAWLHKRRTILYRLRRALNSGELVMQYQPIFDVRMNQVVGAEALMRWPVSAGVATGPDEFIPIAEEGGMIGELTCFAIRRVSEDLAAMLRLRPYFLVSINIVADDLADENFHAALEKHILGAGISPSQIAFELTERRSAAVGPTNKAIDQLRRAGYKIYIDDFGTGFSSLTYLSDLAVDAIKLDKSFTSTVNTGAVRARLVAPILDMARDLGVPVIAEGVEESYQAAYFRTHGVLHMQGGLFGWAVEAPDLLRSAQCTAPGEADGATMLA